MNRQRKSAPKSIQQADAFKADSELRAAMHQQAVSLLPVFQADAMQFQGAAPDLTAVFGYWVGYPAFLEWIGFGPDWTGQTETAQAYRALSHAHILATRILMREAAKRGLDPHALYECGRVIQEIYLTDPELCVKRTGATYDTWPESLGAARYALPAGQQEALRAGEGVFIRLALAMDIAQAAPALTPDDRAILQALADSETTRPQADIAAAAERDVKTVRERLKRLETAGLVSRPCGARSGFAITPSGMGLLSSTRD